MPCNYVQNAIMTARGMRPAIVMDWVEADSLEKYIGSNIDRPAVLMELANDFLRMTTALHKSGISHGDLQHGNIIVRFNGELTLVDYDSMYVPGM